MILKKKVLVVDLDGTLYRINTFHYFLMYLIKYSIRKFNLVLLVKIVLYVFLRGTRLISHSKLKFHILISIKNLKTAEYHKFISEIAHKKRKIGLISDSNYDIKILGTAAPACYANIIAKDEGFNFCSATEFPNSEYNSKFENLREIKKDNTMALLKQNGVNEIDTVITDHLDDLPLMKLAKNNIIINPNKKMVKVLDELHLNYEILS